MKSIESTTLNNIYNMLTFELNTGALGALMRDKIEQSKHYDITGIPKCLLLRSKLMLQAKGALYIDRIKMIQFFLYSPPSPLMKIEIYTNWSPKRNP